MPMATSRPSAAGPSATTVPIASLAFRMAARRPTYRYNGLGQRVEKVTPQATTAFSYSTDGQLLTEYQPNGAIIREYVYLNGEPLVLLEPLGSAHEVLYLQTDHLGTPRMATDSGGTAVWKWESDPFGTTAADTDPDGNGTPVTVNLRFPGQYYDQETGLHYNYWRYQDPNTGRYLTADPLGLRAGPNLYTYVHNNPARWIDPLGLDVTTCLYPGFPPHIGLGVNTSDTTGRRTDGTSDLIDIINGEDVPGEVSKDPGKPSSCTTTKTTSKQDDRVQQYIANHMNNPGLYNLYDRSCVDFVRDPFEQILGMPLGDSNLPSEVYRDIFFHNNQ